VETALDLARLLVGGLILYFGAEWLVKGSAGLARALGVKPLIIGLTVVAYGTSAPELAVSAAAMVQDSSPIVLGNVIGSCICNIGLILGLTALIAPPTVDGRLIRREIPVLLLSAVVMPLVLIGGSIGMVESALMLAVAVAFTLFTLLVTSESESGVEETEPEPKGEKKLPLALLTVVGLILLVGGGDLFVEGARRLALTLGMSERLVGLTVVAVGTSLPELAASLVAALRGYSSLAVGNVVGSNIFNIFMILGVVGFIAPVEGSMFALRLDLAFLVGITLLGILFMRGERRIHRVEGALLMAGYSVFVILAAVGG
jgi:cation:H+ antiporter